MPDDGSQQPSLAAAASSRGTAKIAVRGLTKVFGDDAVDVPLRMLEEGRSKDDIFRETGCVVGLSDVSFTVDEGEVFVVMGLSGSGKSTLIRCLNRLIEPTAGTVVVDGEDVTAAPPARLQEIRRTKMSMVFQQFGLLPHKTVLENVAYGLKVQGVPERDRLVEAALSLDLVGLRDWALQKPANLSGGMQQRVGLARALCTDPVILLMDEAFSALDPLIRRQMQDELIQLQERVHKTIVFITHDLNEALRVGNRVMIMQDGVAVQTGTPTEIITSPATQYVADFIQDVDAGRVLRVGTVARDPVTVAGGSSAADARQRLRRAGAAAGFVVDDAGSPTGLLTSADLSRAQGDVSDLIRDDFARVGAQDTLADAYAPAASGHPMAVVDRTGRLVGVLDPLAVLATLGEVEQVAEGDAAHVPGTATGEGG